MEPLPQLLYLHRSWKAKQKGKRHSKPGLLSRDHLLLLLLSAQVLLAVGAVTRC